MVRLYYYPSYVSLFPHILLEEIGLEYELVFIDRYANAHKRPEYIELNPNGLIPVLRDGDLVLYEAAAISLHLIDRNPTAGLAPPLATSERAHFYKWMAWLATHLHPALSMYLHPNKWVQDLESLAALKSNAERRVGELLDIIDAELEKHRGSWLLGSTYSALDAYALTLCRWSRRMQRPAVDWPHFGPYARRVLERPAVRRAFQQEHLAEPWI
jgi:glutathione S-transferase